MLRGRMPDPAPRVPRAAVAALLAVAAAALLVRVPAIAEPLGIDQSLWASAVRGMARGQLLYHDVWEQRPPGIYFTYLAGFSVLGWTPATVAWLDLLASAVTTLALFAVGRSLASPATGAAAAAIYAAFTVPSWLYGQHGGFLERSVCETFIAACAASAAWCAVRWRRAPSPWWAAALGLLSGLCVIYKPNAGIYFPALLAWLACYGISRNGAGSGPSGVERFAWTHLAIAVAAAALVPLLTLAWLWRLDLIGDARVAVLEFNRFYVGQGFSVPDYAVAFSKAVWLRIKTEPLWLAGAAGSIAAVVELARTRRLAPLAGLAVMWGAAAVIAIVVNGARLFNSYFIQAMPPLALAGAWFLANPGAAAHGRWRRAAVWCTVALMLVLAVKRDYAGRVFASASSDLSVLTGRTDATTYLERFGGYANDRGYSARANEELAEFVRASTSPDDTIFLFGINGAGIYFAADRLTAHRFLRVNFFVPAAFPDPSFRLEAVVRDLQERRPRYLIFERLHARSEMGKLADGLQASPALQPLLAGYTLEREIEDFSLYRRRD